MRNSAVVLFVCSGLLLSGGAIMGGTSGWTILRMSYHFWTADLGSELGSGILLVAGSILCLPACWLCSLVPYHPRALTLQCTLMFLATAAMLSFALGLVSLTALAAATRDPADVNATMHRAMARAQYETNVKNAFNAMQLEMRCCGVQSHHDWLQYRRTLPASCCNKNAIVGKHDVCDTAVFTQGCLLPALRQFRYFINTMSLFAAVMIIILTATLFATAYILITSVIETNELRLLKNGSFRVACLHNTLNPSPVYSIYPAAPQPSPPRSTPQEA